MASLSVANDNSIQKSAAVLYHYPCPDGAFAALAAYLYFKATSLPPDQLPLHQFSHVYLLDFVGLLVLSDNSPPKVVILDHHKTAMEALGGTSFEGENVSKVIDMERSGATIAFDYFKHKLLESGKNSYDEMIGEFDRVRRVFEYIEDGDLWRWRLENSKAFSSGLKDLNLEFNAQLNPSLFDQLLSLNLASVISQGRESLSVKQKLIDDTLDQSYEIALGGGASGRCLAVNADSVSELRSELGQQLATKSRNLKLRGIGAIVYRVPELENDEMLKISLRSVDIEDTTPISEGFGGGGHRNASSFMICSAEFERWKVGKSASF
ncbi:phosphoesterase [Salix suchowensis]|nr:phosphoesterase [Salix suchowensis]